MACEYKKVADRFTLKGLAGILSYEDPAILRGRVIKQAWPWYWWQTPTIPPGEPGGRVYDDWYFYWCGFIEVAAALVVHETLKGARQCSVHVAGTWQDNSVLYGVIYPRRTAPLKSCTTIKISTAGRVLSE